MKVNSLLKKLAALMPSSIQAKLKALLHLYQIRTGTFDPAEPEYEILHELIQEGELVIDVGANVGHYTYKFSQLVGKNGRVIAFEPVPETMRQLAKNCRLFDFENVSIFNAAVSKETKSVGMAIPNFASGLRNFYEAHVTDAEKADVAVLTVSIDDLHLADHFKIALIKIDAEGHEADVIEGMTETITCQKPFLIVETGKPHVIERLESFGYKHKRLDKSPNVFFEPFV